MSFKLDCTITAGGTLDCVLTSMDGLSIDDPVLCFSMMVPPAILAGGELIEFTGGFGAVKLSGKLGPDSPLTFTLGHQVAAFKVANRAWYPLGVYIRHEDGSTTDVMTEETGVISPLVPARVPSGLGLVPVPQKWSPSGGTLKLDQLQYTNGALGSAEIAAVNALSKRIGQPPLFGAQGTQFDITQDDMPPESYALEIGDEGIMLRAGDPAGMFYGFISLLVLRAVHGGLVPTGLIEDHPRFSWRGQHLDCARHFVQPAQIKRVLDLMSLLKLNRFHWHFADDEAFRLEVECAPEIWQQTAMRGEGQVLPGLFGGGAGPTGGTYSKDTARELIAHAAALHIEVMPEIEVPSHALALTRVRPELRDPDDTGDEQSVQGYLRNTVNPARQETWDFLMPLADEVAALFPFQHVHIGGDELPENTWAGSPQVTALKRQEDLADHVDVQGYTMARLATHLRAAGITPCAWEESALGSNGGIGNDAVIFSWTGQGPVLAAARRGHPVVMCPAQHTYWDMARTSDTADWGANWAANFGLSDTLNWDPVPEDEPSLESAIIGVEGAYWGEFTVRDKDMEAMFAPRILGLSCKGWSERHAVAPLRLKELALGFQSLFSAMNWDVNGHELI